MYMKIYRDVLIFYGWSPYNFNGSNANVFNVNSSGNLNNNNVNNTNGVRPVISLKSNALKYGNGSSGNPFRVTQ